MKIPENTKEFVPAPEYHGQGCVVDVTPLKETDHPQYGKRKTFQVVIELDLLNDEGTPWHVWSTRFTPSFHEKSGFRKFLKELLGYDMNKEERETFDTEDIIGKNCYIVVIHNTDGERTFANIASCTPWKDSSKLMKPHPSFKRLKDRPEKDVTTRKTDQPKPAVSEAPAKPSAPAEATDEDHLSVKVHVGNHRGVEFRELDAKAIDKLDTLWVPTTEAAEKQSADDRRLMAAIKWYKARKKEEVVDECPF
jgi:hypothetical protein